MIKNLQKYGNSHALVIDKALMEAAGITPETPLQVTVQSGGITLTPANVGIGREKLGPILDRVQRDYSRALKKLSE
jgi:antitoxin component of MazEF toxin-antitoxin module